MNQAEHMRNAENIPQVKTIDNPQDQFSPSHKPIRVTEKHNILIEKAGTNAANENIGLHNDSKKRDIRENESQDEHMRKSENMPPVKTIDNPEDQFSPSHKPIRVTEKHNIPIENAGINAANKNIGLHNDSKKIDIVENEPQAEHMRNSENIPPVKTIDNPLDHFSPSHQPIQEKEKHNIPIENVGINAGNKNIGVHNDLNKTDILVSESQAKHMRNAENTPPVKTIDNPQSQFNPNQQQIHGNEKHKISMENEEINAANKNIRPYNDSKKTDILENESQEEHMRNAENIPPVKTTDNSQDQFSPSNQPIQENEKYNISTKNENISPPNKNIEPHDDSRKKVETLKSEFQTKHIDSMTNERQRQKSQTIQSNPSSINYSRFKPSHRRSHENMDTDDLKKASSKTKLQPTNRTKPTSLVKKLDPFHQQSRGNAESNDSKNAPSETEIQPIKHTEPSSPVKESETSNKKSYNGNHIVIEDTTAETQPAKEFNLRPPFLVSHENTKQFLSRIAPSKMETKPTKPSLLVRNFKPGHQKSHENVNKNEKDDANEPTIYDYDASQMKHISRIRNSYLKL